MATNQEPSLKLALSNHPTMTWISWISSKSHRSVKKISGQSVGTVSTRSWIRIQLFCYILQYILETIHIWNEKIFSKQFELYFNSLHIFYTTLSFMLLTIFRCTYIPSSKRKIATLFKQNTQKQIFRPDLSFTFLITICSDDDIY